MADRIFDINHTRIKRTTQILRVRKDPFKPMTLIVDFEHALPSNYYKSVSDIIYGLYLDREFIEEFLEKTATVQLISFDAISLLEVFAHPHPGFQFIRSRKTPGNKIVIRFRAKNPVLRDILKHRFYWDAATGTILEKRIGEQDALTGEASGIKIRSGRIYDDEIVNLIVYNDSGVVVLNDSGDTVETTP